MFTRNEAVVLVAACAAVLVGLALPWFRASPRPVVSGTPEPLPSPSSTAPPAPLVVSLNLATAEELERLPGIGPVLARRIVEDRARHGQYTRLEDLLRVKGVGPKKLDRLRPYLRVP
ncbi:MAG: ComEA family DNA-binding protein [Armatimonadota bacterium]|nr:ComEA family DNA-binding protein [Armatimonadota bacterium]